MQSSYIPSAASQAFRKNLSDLIRPLKSVRSRVPFFRLAAHRTPTRWSLYRNLLRASPSENVRNHYYHAFTVTDKHRHSTEGLSTR